MRATLLTLLFSFGQLIHAQNFPFPTSNATWVQYFEVMITPPPVPQFAWMSAANFCMDASDTLIAGTSYSRLHLCASDYVGGIREEEGTVYFLPADSTQEYLLYDFSAAEGDTIHDVYVNEPLGLGGSSGWVGTQLVDVRVLTAAPDPNYGGRIRMQVQAIDPNIGMDSEWIEGMGCYHGLFTFNPINISEYWYGLDCFSHNDTTYWNGWYTETPGTCVPQYVGFSDRSAPTTRAYPNPTAGTVRVEGLANGRTLMVRDALGRVVHVPVATFSNEALDMDLSGLPAGIYSVLDGAGRSVRISRE